MSKAVQTRISNETMKIQKLRDATEPEPSLEIRIAQINEACDKLIRLCEAVQPESNNRVLFVFYTDES
jgi:hypothetical protein